jgi:hypothetical protein
MMRMVWLDRIVSRGFPCVFSKIMTIIATHLSSQEFGVSSSASPSQLVDRAEGGNKVIPRPLEMENQWTPPRAIDTVEEVGLIGSHCKP